MYYVVARFRGGRYMANISSDQAESERLVETLQREGIPTFSGQASDVSSADPRLRQALELAKE